MRIAFRMAHYEDPRVWLLPLLGALCAIDRQYRILVPRTPSVYDAGLRYEAEGRETVTVPCNGPGGQCIEVRPCECWADTPTIFCAGAADCEDLACDRAAQLQLEGRRVVPWPIIPPPNRSGRRTIHIVCVEGGRIVEDPSARLGMPVPPGYPVEGDRV